jgi:preprotein translocase subunit SecF
MELFKNTNFDLLGWKKPLIVASLVLSVAGLTSLWLKGGPRYGIDFKGGTVMTVKFAGKPPIDEIRSAVSNRVTGGVSVQTFESQSGEVAIGTELADPKLLDQNRRMLLGRSRPRSGTPRPESWISTAPGVTH